jgi:hypothetical protein
MSTYNILSFSFLLSLSSFSFGVKVNNTNIPVQDRQGMNKVYQAIKPIITKKDLESVAEILAKAYIEYARLQRNLDKDQKDGIFWPYLGCVAKYCSKNVSKDQLFKRLKSIALQGLQRALLRSDKA